MEEFLFYIPTRKEKIYYLKAIRADMARSGPMVEGKTWVKYTLEKLQAERDLFKEEAIPVSHTPIEKKKRLEPIRLGISQAQFVYHFGALFAKGVLNSDSHGIPWALLSQIFVTKEGKSLNPKTLAQTYENINTSPPKSHRLSDDFITETIQFNKEEKT